MNFLREQFDKLLVSLFLVFAVIFLMHLIHHTGSGDDANINQAWGMVQFFLGLFGGLVTGRAISKAEADSKKPSPENSTPIPGEKL